MNKLYSTLRFKIEKLQLAGSSVLKLNFYKTLFGILEYVIVLTQGAGNSFPLIFQARGRQIIDRSYKDFKSYQRKVRLIFLLLIALILLMLKIY